MDALNKKNFWDEMQKECPDAVQDFNKWLYGYYKKVKWEQFMPKAKFYDLPIEMQVGILFKYFDMMDYGHFNTDELKECLRDKQQELKK